MGVTNSRQVCTGILGALNRSLAFKGAANISVVMYLEILTLQICSIEPFSLIWSKTIIVVWFLSIWSSMQCSKEVGNHHRTLYLRLAPTESAVN